MDYVCGDCGKVLENVDMSMPLRCPFCGYKVLYKARVKIAKKVRAR